MADDFSQMLQRAMHEKRAKVWTDPDRVCPHCGKKDDEIAYIGHGMWFFCRKHKVTWFAGSDYSIDVDEAAQQRRYSDLGLDQFETIGEEERKALLADPNKIMVARSPTEFVLRRQDEVEFLDPLTGLPTDIWSQSRPRRGDGSLESMLRHMSRQAERRFKQSGEVPLAWLLENGDGRQTIVVSPVYANDPAEGHATKDRIDAAMRVLFRQQGVVRFCVATEAWMVFDKQFSAEEYQRHPTLRDVPGRREGMVFVAEDARNQITAYREIHRPQNGKAYLGTLEITDPNLSAGRFQNMLRPQRPDA